MVCISLRRSGLGGLTIVLMTDHPGGKKNAKGTCPFLGTLLPLVVKDVGRIDLDLGDLQRVASPSIARLSQSLKRAGS